MKGTLKQKEQFLQQLGVNLKRIRAANGFSQEYLADLCGLDRTYISGIERGIRNPSIYCIFRISLALDVHPDKLLVGQKQLQKQLGRNLCRE